MNEVLLKKGDIELKTFSLNEANKLYQLIEKNRDYMGEWLIWVDKTKSVEDVEKMMQGWNERREKGERIHFGIWYQEKLIGVVYFSSIDKDYRKGAIGYWLDSDYQGKGIMTESCKCLIEYGFNDLNLHRIEISCAEGNSKSRAIPERLGFTEEGIFRESELIRGGKLADNHHYALLEQDWKK
ncbi:MAG: GNAT family protein [bacterium]